MTRVRNRFKILSAGQYLPGEGVSANELQNRMQVDENWILRKAGVANRYYAQDETIASMASKAIIKAMDACALDWSEIDLLIAAGGTPDQPIPHNSALIHHELKLTKRTTPVDINATCLSFVQALITASCYLECGIYNNIVIVSSEKSSVGLNYNQPESAALMGDGAVAFVLCATRENQGLLFSDFETYSEGAHLAEIKAGGTRIHPKQLENTQSEDFLFNMNGEKIFRLVSRHMENFFYESLKRNEYTLDDFNMIVPHQASLLAMTIIRKKLRIPKAKFLMNVNQYGNLVAASVPMGICDLLEEKAVCAGDRILMLCTAAGLTLGNVGIQL